MWRESRRLFVRPDVIRPTPTAVDLAYLRWLDAAWSEAVSGHGGSFDAALGPRRAMLLGELEAAGILDAREPMIALLAARGHTGLIRAGDAVRELLRYLKSPERRAHTGCGYYGLVAGAWGIPVLVLARRSGGPRPRFHGSLRGRAPTTSTSARRGKGRSR
jgi:hypothetical protein